MRQELQKIQEQRKTFNSPNFSNPFVIFEFHFLYAFNTIFMGFIGDEDV